MSQKNLIKLVFLIITGIIVLQPIITNGSVMNPIDSHISSSCTIFTASIGDIVLFGNNEDYKYNNAYRWYMPAQNVSTQYYGIKEIYGAVFFGFDNNNDSNVDGWEQGGMNEYGLCYDGNGLPDVALNLDPLASYPYTPNALAQVLWDCQTVEEVIDWYQNHKWTGNFGGQIHYADSFGDAVVVSVNSTGKWTFTRIDSDFIVSTNFYLENVSQGSYPCWRYDKATEMLNDITAEEELTVSAFADILYEVHQEGTYATKYSNICDPVNLEFYFNSGENFSVSDKFNLIDKLTEIEAFEEKESFFGVTGTDGGVLVRTEKIDIQFETSTASETNGMTILVSVSSLLLIGLTYSTIRRGKKKRAMT